ncbi:MAG: AMP-binding protein, partial [Flavobacteriaceae bacterium]
FKESIDLSVEISSDDLMYVIYTSGTTGRPKGVLLEHRNAVRLFFNDEDLFDFTSSDVWCMFHSFSFDFSIWEMYGALLFGGKLVVVPQSYTKDPYLFSGLLRDNGVTILNQTPSAFNVLQEIVLEQDKSLEVRYVIFGGEALSPSMLKGWKERYDQTRFINMYGITETTVHVTYKEIGAEEILSNVSNIGVPIPTLGCFILDDSMNLLPRGIKGELYVIGSGLARGYLNLPELTEARFPKNPYSLGDHDSHMYRT